ncbi:MAG: hypothetical protein AAGA74_10975 [Pseudomonadota bacterium]
MQKYLAIAAALLASACMSTTDSATPSVVSSLVGKTLVTGNTTFIFNQDGTVGGSLNGETIVGVYSADASQVCSSYTAPARFAGVGEICSVPVIDGGTVVFNRTNGSRSPVYTIEG